MCTAWIDAVNGVAHHLAQTVDLAIIAAADVPALRAQARDRGWDKLRLLSAGESTFNMISAGKIMKDTRTPLSRYSLETATASCATFTAFIRGWLRTSRSVG